MNTLPDNPYVGPRSFRREESSKFFGREDEARDLLSLVISEQLVLFYAESGAGKSSLINTCLIPRLEERRFEVLPVGRVSSAFVDSSNMDNIYIFNLMMSLDQSKRDPRRLVQVKLTHFLNNLVTDGQNFYYADRPSQLIVADSSTPIEILPRALIIDQFEELITTHPEAWQKREDFFRQLADAMKADPYLWVVLVMREDYVAALDPYAHLLPGQLRSRYYMRRMGVESALDAIRKPVEKIRAFEAGVPELLVDNMRLITASKISGQNDQPVYGEFVEPVQLQVVCYQLWERIQKYRRITSSAPTINRNDLIAIAKGESIAQFISNSLADFYEQAIAKVLSDPGVKVQEGDLRDWFTHKLITEAETRGFVYRGTETTEGLPNRAIDILASQYIIRSESKAGGVWIELVHDRFVGPILQANRKWAEKHQRSVLTDATAWEKSGKSAHLLYDGKQLESSLAELEVHPDQFTTIEKAFIRASQRATSRRRWIALGTATFLVIIILATSLFFVNEQATQARKERDAVLTQSVNSELNRISSKVTQAIQDVVITELQVQLAQLATQNADLAAHPQITQTVEAGTPISGASATPTPSATATPSLIGEEVIGSSFKGKELRAYHFGIGSRHVVLVGGLHAGFAPSTMLMAERLKDYLGNNLNLIPPNITVDLITLANPDSLSPSGQDFSGRIEGRLNGNGVDLNRNWGCDWSLDAVWQNKKIGSGGAEFSEDETRALRDFITGKTGDKLTVAVVFWEARDNPPSVSPGGCGDFSVYSDPLSRLYANAAGYRAQDFAAYALNGDATNWLDSQGIGAITVLLPSYTELSQEDFQANVNAIIQVLQIYGR